MKIGITSDHGGYLLKEKIKKYFKSKKIDFVDYGTNSQEPVDYPDFAYKLTNGILNKEVNLGIAICKTGIGMSIASNKVKNIRCAKVCSKKEARLSKQHNNANIIALSGKISKIKAKFLIKEFINTKFEENRHTTRIKKIEGYEND